MNDSDWPKPPIWPKDLPLIRQLMTEEGYATLLRRLVWTLPGGPLLFEDQLEGASIFLSLIRRTHSRLPVHGLVLSAKLRNGE